MFMTFKWHFLACTESFDLSESPIIAGASWDFTNNWDCGGNDIESHHVTGWGQDGSIKERKSCADRCLSLDTCVAFNFPNSPRTSGNCYMKHTYQKSTTDGRNWNCGGNTASWQYYTLIDKKATCSGINTRNNMSLKTIQKYLTFDAFWAELIYICVC